MTTRTLVLVAHPDLVTSTSQQFLMQAGIALQDNVTYVDLQAELLQKGRFDIVEEWERLRQYERYIFQFQLYWYQAPAVLKIWLDTVFDGSAKMYQWAQHLQQKELGIVVVAGVKASEYQSAGRERVTMDALLSPYVAFAHHFHMILNKPLLIHQFRYLTEQAKQELMYRYGCYLEHGVYDRFALYQAYLLKKARHIQKAQLPFNSMQQAIFDTYLEQLERQMAELNEVAEMVTTW